MANAFWPLEQPERGLIMRHGLVIGCTFLALVLAACGGFWVGVREGWGLALMENAVHIGVVALPRLDAVKNGRASELDKAFEFDVDSGLVWSYHFLASPLAGFLAPVWGISSTGQDPQNIAHLANYRKIHPSPTNSDLFDDVHPRGNRARGVDERPTAIDERLAIVNNMVRRYATNQ